MFADLFDPAGSEIYLKPAGDYLVPGDEADFATRGRVGPAARRGRDRLPADRALPRAARYGVVLNPDKTAPLTLAADDRVIVLAED